MVLPHLGKKIQEQSFTFNCHIKGRRKSFTVSISGTASVKELIQLINQQGGLMLDFDSLEENRLLEGLSKHFVHCLMAKAVKPIQNSFVIDIPIEGPLEGIKQEDYPSGTLLNNTMRMISTIWKEQPSNINIDIFVQLPKKELHAGTGKQYFLFITWWVTSTGITVAQDLCLANEVAITFTIPSRDGFSNLKLLDINEEVGQETYIPAYLKAFLEALKLPYVVLPDVSAGAGALSQFLLSLTPCIYRQYLLLFQAILMSAAFGNFNTYFQHVSSGYVPPHFPSPLHSTAILTFHT